MVRLRHGSVHLFRIARIDIYLHWSWLLIAFLLVILHNKLGAVLPPAWVLIAYITLFGIVLLHELGHALACRQVGGSAPRIIMWPLGGIAMVQPPPRPGALLWSIAAGPLVNVLLIPATFGLCAAAGMSPDQVFLIVKNEAPVTDFQHYLALVAVLNLGLLIFNLFPIYPLDGGQILQALLWFVITRAQSLLVVSILGLIGGLGMLALAVASGQAFWVVVTVFLLSRSWVGFQQARLLVEVLNGPRHAHLACPSCGEAPPRAKLWTCDRCRAHFDTFDHGAVCPWCAARFRETACPHCHRRHPIAAWYPKALPAEAPGEDVPV